MPLTDQDLWGAPAPAPSPTPTPTAQAPATLRDEDLWGAPPKAAADKGSGVAANFGAGAAEGAWSTSDMIRDALINPRAVVDRAWNMAASVFGAPPVRHTAPTMGDLLTIPASAAEHKASSSVIAATPVERIARSMGAGAGAGLSPVGEALTVGRILSGLATGAGAGLGAGAGAEAAPENLKPIAGIVGGLVGGSGVAGVEAAARGSIRAGRTMAQQIWASQSEDQATAQANRMAASDPTSFAAASLSPKLAEQQAGRIITTRAADSESALASISEGPQEIVPGSVPTTFQQTADLGLGALEREQRTKNPAVFREREAEQAAARNTALEAIQPEGDPTALAQGIRTNFARLENDTQKAVDQAIETAHQKVAEVKGDGLPEDYGHQIREAIGEAESAARARESGLWEALDPNRDLTGNVNTTRHGAAEVVGGMAPTAKPMAGEEAAIFQAAQAMPELAPVQDLIALRSRVSTEMRNELIANGRSPPYARLSRLRGMIQDNLSNTITERVAEDQAAVARGAMPAEDAAASRIQEWIDAYRDRQAQGVPASAGAAGELGAGGTPPPRAGIPAEGGSGGAAEPEGVPQQPAAEVATPEAGVPTFDEAAADRLKLATAATAQRARTFGTNPVSPTTAKAGAQDMFKLPEGKVPAKFFHPGPTGFTDMQALFKAVGEAKALPVVVDYAASLLRRAAMNPDGTMDALKYRRWAAQHQDALRALPADVRAKFMDAAQASQAATAAAASRALTLKGFQQGAIGKVLGLEDHDAVVRTVGSILGAKTAVTEVRHLMRVARDAGPDAVSGLRRAIAEHIEQRLMGNTEVAASDATALKADAFQTFVRRAEPALRIAMPEQAVDSLLAIAKDIQRAKRSENALKLPAQSNTAQDLTALSRSRDATSGARSFTARHAKSILDVIAGAGGFAVHGPETSILAILAAHKIQTLREIGIQRVDQAVQALHEQGVQSVDDLLTEAMLHPSVAHALMKKGSSLPGPLQNVPDGRPLAIALRKAMISTGAAVDSQQPLRRHDQLR